MIKAYHQGFMHEQSSPLIAFATAWRLYEWIRIPFGLSNVPPTFQGCMTECLDDLSNTVCIPDHGGILCYWRMFDELLQNVKTT